MTAESPVATHSPTGGPIQYELRIGVTGHRQLDDPEGVARAVRALLHHVVNVLECASADPLGPHGSPQSRVDRLDRSLTQILSLATHAIAPPLDLLTAVIAAPIHGLTGATRWPRVPVSPRRPGRELQTPLKLTVISSLAKGADQIAARAVCDLVS